MVKMTLDQEGGVTKENPLKMIAKEDILADLSLRSALSIYASIKKKIEVRSRFFWCFSLGGMTRMGDFFFLFHSCRRIPGMNFFMFTIPTWKAATLLFV
jgi:hypothetical protein